LLFAWKSDCEPNNARLLFVTNPASFWLIKLTQWFKQPQHFIKNVKFSLTN